MKKLILSIVVTFMFVCNFGIHTLSAEEIVTEEEKQLEIAKQELQEKAEIVENLEKDVEEAKENLQKAEEQKNLSLKAYDSAKEIYDQKLQAYLDADYKEAGEALEEELENAKKDLEQAQKDRDDINKEIESLNQTLNQTKQNLEKARQDYEKVKAEIEESEKTIAKYGDDLTAKQAEVDLATQVLETYRNELSDAQEKILDYTNTKKTYDELVEELAVDRAELARISDTETLKKNAEDAQKVIDLGSAGFFDKMWKDVESVEIVKPGNKCNDTSLRAYDIVTGNYLKYVDTTLSPEQVTLYNTYYKYTDLNDPRDATNLANMKKAIEFMFVGNEYRRNDGLSEFLVNDELMAKAQVRCNAAAWIGTHPRELFGTGENLFVGGDAVTDAKAQLYYWWYDDELNELNTLSNTEIRHIYEYVDGTRTSLTEIEKSMLDYIGHYLNLINPRYRSSGMAYTGKIHWNPDRIYGIEETNEWTDGHVTNQVFVTSTKHTMTVQEYYDRFMAYYGPLEKAVNDYKQAKLKINYYTLRIEGLTVDIPKYEKLVEEKQLAIAQFTEEKMQEMISKVDEQIKIVEALTSELKEITDEISAENSKLTLAKAQKEAKEAEIKNSEESIDSANKEVNDAKKELKETTELIEELTDEEKQAQAKLDLHNKTVEKVEKELDELKEDLDKKEEKKDADNYIYTSATTLLEELSGDLDEAKNDKEKIENNIKDLEGELAKEYTITYKLNGGSADNPTKYTMLDSFTLTNPTKVGYTFIGWTYEGQTTPIKVVTIVKGTKGNKEFTANFEPNNDTPYKVNHYIEQLNAKFVLKETENLTGTTDSVITPKAKSYEGFTSVGEQEITINAEGTTKVDYYYLRNSYLLTINMDNGVDGFSTREYKYEQPVQISAWLKTGYKDLSYQGVSSNTFLMPANDLTVYITSTPIEYQLSYTLNGGTSENPLSYNIESETFTLNNPTKVGYTFIGWTGSNGDVPQLTITIPTGSTEDREYIANYKIIDYTITYNLDGSTNPEENIEAYNVETETFSLIAPTKTGYTFVGWTYEGQNTPVKEVTIEKGSTGDKEFTAHFEANKYVLHYDGENETLTYDQPFKLKKMEDGEGRFMGWALVENGEIKFANEEEVLNLVESGEITLYPIWNYDYKTSAPYVVGYSETVDYGTAINLVSLTEDATIYYSFNDEFVKFTKPILLTESVVLKAYAISQDREDSDVVEITINVNPKPDYNDVLDEDIAEYFELGCPDGLWMTKLEDLTFNPGDKYTQNFRVYDGQTILVEKVDYTVSYKNNTKVGTATITITGKGNYTGKLTQTFEIKKHNLIDADVTLQTVIENGKDQKLKPTVTLNAKKLSTSDYTLIYEDAEYKSAGQHTVTIVGKGNYEGTVVCTYEIASKEKTLISKVSASKLVNYNYDGNEHIQPIKLTNKKDVLEEGVDYTLDYSDTTSVGTVTVTVNGIGGYVGTKTLTYKINGVAINKAKLSGLVSTVYYNGEKQTQDLVLTYNNVKLKENEDYTLEYSNNLNAGKATVKITGINGYTGTLTKTFTIKALALTDADVEIEDVPYSKAGAKPNVIVTRNGEKLDYTLTYSNNTAVTTATTKKLPTVTIKLKGNYSGTIKRTFNIVEADLESLDISVNDKVYSTSKNGWKSAVTITDNGKKLASNEYSVEYTYLNDVKVLDGSQKTKPSVQRRAGEKVRDTDILPENTVVHIKVTGSKNYHGTLETNYRIIKTDISKTKVTIKAKIFTGNEIELDESDITVKLGKDTVDSENIEIVSYKNNINKGTATVTLRGIKNLGGTKSYTFKITSRTLAWWTNLIEVIS